MNFLVNDPKHRTEVLSAIVFLFLTVIILYLLQIQNGVRDELKIKAKSLSELKQKTAQTEKEKSVVQNNLKNTSKDLSLLLEQSNNCLTDIYHEDLKRIVYLRKTEDKEFWDLFFNNDQMTNIRRNGYFSQICLSYGDSIPFTISLGEGGKHIIGLYRKDKIITDENKPSPNGVCQITGFLEGNIIYSCGGGDGPCYENRIYVLNKNTGERTLLKDCGGCGAENGNPYHCNKNILNLPVP